MDVYHCCAFTHSHLPAYDVGMSSVCSFIKTKPNGFFTDDFTHDPAPEGVRRDVAPAPGVRVPEYKEDINDEGIQITLFSAMSSLMLIVKPMIKDKANEPYLFSRWGAMLAKLGLPDLIKGAAKDAVEMQISAFSNVCPMYPKRNHMMKKFIIREITENMASHTLTAKALLEQVKMVWEHHGMQSLRLMYDLVKDGNDALCAATLAEEGIRLITGYRNLSADLASMAPYAGILNMVPPSLTVANFPNLYHLMKLYHEHAKTMKN